MAKRFPSVILSVSFCLCLFTTLPSFTESKTYESLQKSPDRFDQVVKLVEETEKRRLDGEADAADKFFRDLGEFQNELVEDSEIHHPCRRTCETGKQMTCRYEFTIEYYSTMSKMCFDCPFNKTDCNTGTCIPGDGVKKTILVINRQLPGPAIEVCYGDTIEVEVKNRMLDISTTIHWHGLPQKETPYMDGVPFVTQCVIAPQSDFTYRFPADNSGSHFWHSHSALQRGDGMFGPLIVRVPPTEELHADLYDFDLYEHKISILDWQHRLSVNKFMDHYHADGDNKPPSILVNGKGRFQQFHVGDEVVYTPTERFTVKPGFRYRFRLINAGFLNCPIEVSVDNHNITIIASDGEDIKPIEAESLVTFAGERFDFVIHADQEVGNYWMRFKGLLDCSVKKAIQYAVLHYEGAENADPEAEIGYENSVRNGLQVNAVNTPTNTEGTLVVSELSSLSTNEDPALKPVPDLKLYMPYDFYPVNNVHFQYPANYGFYTVKESRRTYTPQLNHISMKFPNFALMANPERSDNLQFCNSTTVSMECRFQFCECPHIIEVDVNAVIELILIDEGVPFDANHPFHFHGNHLRVVGSDRLGHKTSEEEVRRLDEEGLLKRNLVDPPTKDTVSVPDGGYVILRFQAKNPGYWILHCHLDFHVEMGMALLFKIGDSSTYKQPPKGFPQCGDPFRPMPLNRTTFASFFPQV